jgi:hypothetical protein
MNEEAKFDYDVPSRDTLAGIYVGVDDVQPVPPGPVPAQRAAAPVPGPGTGHPRPEDLAGITLTFDDCPSDCRLDNRPPQPPPPQPEQSPPGS